MAFNKKTWKARIAEHPARRILKFVLTGTESVVEVARDEGAVAQDGDAFSAGNMNDLEQRIADGFDAINADSISGVLPVNNGGTGVTVNPSMLTNLASATAASVFAATPRPGVTGTLPVKNGGTGNTSVDTTPTSGSTKMVTSGGVYTALANKTVAASKVTDGTLGGKVVANAAATADISTAQVRNIVMTSTDPGAGTTSSHSNGTVVLVYE